MAPLGEGRDFFYVERHCSYGIFKSNRRNLLYISIHREFQFFVLDIALNATIIAIVNRRFQMNARKLISIVKQIVIVTAVLVTVGLHPASAGQKVLQSFTGSNGEFPFSGLTPDNAGNFYGTTEYGCSSGLGCVYEISPVSGGGWTETVIYNFDGGVDLDEMPLGGVIFDKAGNLYGTAFGIGVGDVYELSPAKGGGWSEQVIYGFQGFNGDADGPRGNLIFDGAGNLFGTTQNGGSCTRQDGCGAVYELSPNSNGQWTETVVYSFQNNGQDGMWPISGLISDAEGNFYGTTFYGGNGNCRGGGISGCGTVFELSSQSGGGWTEKVLYSFQRNGSDGVGPASALTFDQAGDLLSTTETGGTGVCPVVAGCGTVFELSLQANGQWNESIVHDFGLSAGDGIDPEASLTMDSRGKLYGTTGHGGTGNCKIKPYHGCGTVFSLSAQSGGGWSEKVIDSFPDRATEPHYPNSPVVFDPMGNIYGTTALGGSTNVGAIFELTTLD